MALRYHVASFDEQNRLEDGLLKSQEGIYVHYSWYGQPHFPGNPHVTSNTWHPFAHKSKQDKLKQGLIRTNIPFTRAEGKTFRYGNVSHYVSIDRIDEIVNPNLPNLHVRTAIKKGLELVVNLITP